MNKTTIIIIVLIILGARIYYFASNNKYNTNTTEINNTQQTPAQNTPTPTVNNSKAVNSAPVTVNIKNFAFNPSVLSIKAGTNVVWVNDDSVPHTITSDSGDFDSGNIAPGGSFNHTFTKAGSVSYHCNIHKTMKGQIIVQ